ncbi:ER membrane protein complex subunit 2-B [Leucoagaricus sp. SymC.cos]|nr:ER membrane protein complex subunit 2-B [Leucoagaricus sp. SymC.cos]
MSPSTALEQLASFRAQNLRASQEFLDKASPLLKDFKNTKVDDDVWPVIEQLAMASLDVGRLDIAKTAWKALADRIGQDSPRVILLQGLIMEATEPLDLVLRFYESEAQKNAHNPIFWKRQVAVLRQMGKTEDAVNELRQLLDTFYNDLEAWLELADLYSSCCHYSSTLQALSHALLLAPQNPFTFLQFAETVFTAGDIPLALKNFLIVIDMNDSDVSAPQDQSPTGITVRAWWGVKLVRPSPFAYAGCIFLTNLACQCARRLLYPPGGTASESASKTPIPKNLKLIDQLATERVLTAYSGERGIHNRDVVSRWMSRD